MRRRKFGACMKIGTDIVYIPRIAKALEKKAFKSGVFTESEQEYCDGKSNPANSYAGIFCVKEAAVKAVKCGFSKGVRPVNIEVGHDDCGAPFIITHGAACVMFDNFVADVSIAHDGDYAIATVVLCEKRSDDL